MVGARCLCEFLFSRSAFWTFTFCCILVWTPVKASTLVVNVTKSCYQAEENHNITLEWTFTTTPDRPWRFLFIYCDVFTDHGVLVLYQVHNGVEVSESQHEHFSGRVQSDRDVLREGRIRLHVSRLTTEDSGLYFCDVQTEGGVNTGRCRLNVTEPKLAKVMTSEPVLQRNLISPAPQDETVGTGPRSRLPLWFAVISFIISLNLILIFKLKKDQKFKEKLLRRASTLECGCLAQEQVCVHVDGSSMRPSLLQLSDGLDSNQQLQHPGKPGKEPSLQSRDHG